MIKNIKLSNDFVDVTDSKVNISDINIEGDSVSIIYQNEDGDFKITSSSFVLLENETKVIGTIVG